MAPVTVLYADDDEDDLILFEEAVDCYARSNGRIINLSLVKNGVGLIEKIIEVADANLLVLLDLNMPIKSGFELLQDIRKNELISDATVIIFSTSNNEKMICKSLKYGANYYLAKPNDFTGLEKAIDKILGKDLTKNQNKNQEFIISA